jgi:hypothetical protein
MFRSNIFFWICRYLKDTKSVIGVCVTCKIITVKRLKITNKLKN